MSEFSRYTALRQAGASPVDVWRQATNDGVDAVKRIRLVRELFGLTLIEAKAVSVKATSGRSLDEHYDGLAEGLEAALADEDETDQSR